MDEEKSTKVTFYADPDVKEWLDSLDSGLKSKTINELLREGKDQRSSVEEKLSLIDSRIRKLEKDAQFDGFAISAIRRIMVNRFGDRSAEEFKKEYEDFFFGSQRPTRSL